MKNKINIILLLLLVIFNKNSLAFSFDGKFPVFNALLYNNMPDIEKDGLFPIRVIYEGELWDEGDDMSEPDINRVMISAEKAKNSELVCIDIEHWDVQGSQATVNETIEKYITIANSFKEVNTFSSIGFYMVLPIRDYWRSIFPNNTENYNEWLNENAALAPISDSVNAVFPSLYTFYNNPEKWKKYAIENIKEARKYGKPVYAFLWPMYHNSSTLYGQYIPRNFWKLQLETCFQYADGIVLWGGKDEEWSNNAPWWNEVKKFIKNPGKTTQNVPYFFILD